MDTARRPGVMEVMHNLDYCDVLVIGDELNPERESLEIHHSALLGKHLDATNSTSGISIYGRSPKRPDKTSLENTTFIQLKGTVHPKIPNTYFLLACGAFYSLS